MPQVQMDMLFCLTFIIILLVLLRIRPKIARLDRQGINLILTGVTFLAAMSGFKLAGSEGLFENFQFLKVQTNRQLLEALMIAGGLIFLFTGIGRLLPALGKRKTGINLNRRYFSLKMIGQAINRATSVDESLQIVSTHLTTYLNFPRCAAYKYSATRNMLFCCGSTGFDTNFPDEMKNINIGETSLKTILHRLRTVMNPEYVLSIQTYKKPDIIMPIGHNGRLYGSVFCWLDDKHKIDNDLQDFLTSLGDLIGKQIAITVANNGTLFYRTQEESQARLTDICSQAGSVGDVMTDLFHLMKDVTGTEYVSLAVLDNSGENMIRYTVGSGGRMLFEKGVSRCTRGSYIHEIYRQGYAKVAPKANLDDENGIEDGLFISCGMRSRLACPVAVGNKVLAVMTLGHSRSGYFKELHIKRVTGLTAILGSAIQREHLLHDLEVKEDQMLRLQLMERGLVSDMPLQAVLDNACEMLTKRMKCTMARISLIDKERTNLISQTCQTIRRIGHDLNENGSIPLSLLPWHRMVLEERKLMLINQNDAQSRMQAQESSQALLPKISSAILVPIMLGDMVRGIISIGEVRNWNRRPFGASDLIFAKDIAAKCSVALKMKKMKLDMEQKAQRSKGIAEDIDGRLAAIRNKLTTPISSIVGSVELLRHRDETDQKERHYYDKILKAADQVKIVIEDESGGKARRPELEVANP